MLTLYDEYLTQAIEAGARGYLLKDIKREELAEAIRRVHRGEVVISESIKNKNQFGNGERDNRKAKEGSATLVEEIQLVLPPPVEANQLMRFASRAEEALKSRVSQVVGSWQEGTIMTIILTKAIGLADIMNTIRDIPEVEAIGEEPLTREINPSLIKKAAAIPRLKNRTRKAIFIALEKG